MSAEHFTHTGTVEDFHPGDEVQYVPLHAHGDLAHPDCEYGAVSSVSSTTVFVKFVNRFQPQGCYPWSLRKL